METYKSFLVKLAILFLVVGLSGCATNQNYIPDAARPQALQAVSVPHPVEIEKAGDKYVVFFTGILDAGTWGVENIKGIGIWPVQVEQKDGKYLVGYTFVTDLNFFGDLTLQFAVVGRKEQLLNSKIIYLDRDGGKIHDLSGKEFDYSPKKFDEDKVYAHQVFQNGMTLTEMQNFWQMYSEKRGIAPDNAAFREVRVGSPAWSEFKQQLSERLGNSYKMPSGEIREGYLSTPEFKEQSANNDGVTKGQRFARNMHVNFGAPDFGVASSILNGLLDASNGPIEGFYARATCLRGDLKPSFRLMQQMYKQLLMQRDVIISDLQMQKKAQ